MWSGLSLFNKISVEISDLWHQAEECCEIWPTAASAGQGFKGCLCNGWRDEDRSGEGL